MTCTDLFLHISDKTDLQSLKRLKEIPSCSLSAEVQANTKTSRRPLWFGFPFTCELKSRSGLCYDVIPDPSSLCFPYGTEVVAAVQASSPFLSSASLQLPAVRHSARWQKVGE